MQKYFVTTDQTADFPQELAKDDFKIIPMSYAVDGTIYDGKTNPFLTPEAFYSQLEQGKTSKTSMVPVEEAKAFFEEILKQGFDVLHISFSSALSGCFEGYLKAAKQLESEYPERNVTIVDSRCASGGEGLLVFYALKKRAEGATLEENAAYVTQLRDHIGHVFTVDSMMHLYRGGRVSKNAAYLGSAIRIKPVLTVDNLGRLIPTNKVIGRRIALHTMADKAYAKGKSFDNEIIIISHGDCMNDALILKGMVLDRFGKTQKILISDIGPVIGSHCGKGVLALFTLTSDKNPASK
jgi:DegV family protein with EDD domain